jgi:anti-sigma regulatory factor (Ser/Thr protein kinase)/multidrug transporter EmrE-like cation transporter
VGLLCAVLSALGTNLSFLFKHRGPSRAPDVDARHPLRSAVDLFDSKWWTIGWSIAVVAFFAHVAALSLLPLSLAQAVLSGGFVLLAVLAERYFGFSLGRRQWLGVTMVAAVRCLEGGIHAPRRRGALRWPYCWGVAAPESRSLEPELPAVPQSVPRARRAVAGMLDGLDVDLWAVGLVVSEAVTNVVLHAYRDGKPGRVRVKASMEAELLTLVVADDGIGMSPNPDSPGLGVGLVLIERLVEHMEIHSVGGTRLVVRLQLLAGTA